MVWMVLNWIQHRVHCRLVRLQRIRVYCSPFRCKISLQWHAWDNHRWAQPRLVNHFQPPLNFNLLQRHFVRIISTNNTESGAKHVNYICGHVRSHFRVSTGLHCGCIATICQRIVCTVIDNGEHFEYDCITCCWQTNRRYANLTNHFTSMQSKR